MSVYKNKYNVNKNVSITKVTDYIMAMIDVKMSLIKTSL